MTSPDLPIVPPLPDSSPLDRRPFQCPRERHPISEAVHYQRLAQGYEGCRTCEHRRTVGPLAPDWLRRAAAAQTGPVSIFRTNGIRGVVPNDLSTEVSLRLARAVGGSLWVQRPSTSSGPNETPAIRRRPPTVVVGHDTRPHSPALGRDLVLGLRESGANVLDAGRMPRPAVQFAVEHWRADAGLYVTGAGEPHQFGGLDLFGPDGVPWSIGGRLGEIEDMIQSAGSRHARSWGGHQTIDPLVPYAASLERDLHGLRPLLVGFAVPDPELLRLIQATLATTPLETRLLSPAELSLALRRGELDLGFLLSEDGTAVEVFDESEARLPSLSLALHLAEELLTEWSHVTVVVEEGLLPTDELAIRSPGGGENDDAIFFHSAGGTHESLATAMLEGGALIGVDLGGRIWLRHESVQCDGLATAIHVLRLMSQRAEPASWLRHAPGLPVSPSLSAQPAGAVA